jgi:hypothetical protein
MFTLVRTLPVPRLLLEQLPALVAALALAEAFYKFHSFTLECVAFLATWFAIDAGVQLGRRWLGRDDVRPTRT